jgi:hypothetical protein
VKRLLALLLLFSVVVAPAAHADSDSAFLAALDSHGIGYVSPEAAFTEDAVDLDNNRIMDEGAAYEAEYGEDGAPRCTFLGDLTGDGDPMPIGRWLSERRVTIRPGLAGTCDLYDTWTDTVIDAKFPGASKMREYKNHGPSPEYRIQAHLYGRGYRNEGFPVKRVAVWFLPRAGFLSRSFVWSEPYDDAVVDAVLDRLDNITVLLDTLRPDENPALWPLFPKTPSNCQYCPFFVPRYNPSNPPHQCTGAGA